MTDPQWQDLLRVIRGDLQSPLPVGMLVDSPWIPNWAGVSMLDYFADEQVWLQANLRAVKRFPDILLLPGFWAEYGMCTEPSAFGAKCIWPENSFPEVARSLRDYQEIRHVKKPNCSTDGLLPFVIRRLQRCREEIEAAGHRIRFATARGPLNIACHLLGPTEFLSGMKTNPEEIHLLLTIITEFIIDWIGWQRTAFDSIEGILLLDDFMGFVGNDDFQQFVLPYFSEIYASQKFPVRFLHNDAFGLITARHLETMGVNLFNFSFNHKLADMRTAAGASVVLMGNIPPQDVLVLGKPDDIHRQVAKMFDSVGDKRRILVSCGGGTPPSTPSANIDALCVAAAGSTVPASIGVVSEHE